MESAVSSSSPRVVAFQSKGCTVSLRVVLLLLVLVVGVIVFAATFAPLYVSGIGTGNEYSSNLRDEILDRLSLDVLHYFSKYFDVVDSFNTLLRFDAVDLLNETRVAQQVCDHYRRVQQSTYIGLKSGIFVRCLQYKGEPFLRSQVRNITHYNEYVINSTTLSVLAVNRNVTLALPYDPRLRPWYGQLSVAQNYSAIYLNFSSTATASTVITAGGPLYGSNGLPVGALAMDIFPTDILQYFATAELTPSGKALLVETGTQTVLGSSFSIPALTSRLIPLSNLNSSGIDTVAAAGAMHCSEMCAVSFGSHRNSGHVDSIAVDSSGLLRLKCILITRDKDFLGDLWKRSDIAIGTSVAALVVIILLSLGVVSRVLSPLADLAVRIEGAADLGKLDQDFATSSFTELQVVQTALADVLQRLAALKRFIPQGIMADDDADSQGQAPNLEASGDAQAANLEQNVEVSGGEEVERSARSIRVDTDSNRSEPQSTTTPLVRINSRRLFEELNAFKKRRVSLLVADLAIHRCTTSDPFHQVVPEFVHTVLSACTPNRGIVQLMRPELIIVSFPSVLHETKALTSAVRVLERASKKLLKLLTIVVDSGEYYSGTLGAHDHRSVALSSPILHTLMRLPELVGMFRGSHLVATEATALAAKVDGYTTIPVDAIEPAEGKSANLRLYDVVPVDGFDAELCRRAFSALQTRQNVAEVIQSLEKVELTNPHCGRLLRRLKNLAGGGDAGKVRPSRRECLGWEDLGDLVLSAQTGLAGESPAHRCIAAYALRFAHAAHGADEGTEDPNQSTQLKTMIRQAQHHLKEKRELATASMAASMAASVEGSPSGGDAGDMFSFFVPVPLPALLDESGPLADSSQDEGIPSEFEDAAHRTWHRSEHVLGKGTFGAVYQGMSDTGVLAAMKFLELKADSVTEDLETETEALTELHHENIVQFIAAAVTKKHLIFCLEFVPGGSLQDVLQSYQSPLPRSVVRKYARDVLHGLEYLHSRNVVHCDIKPGNVLVAADGTCKITDFGSAVFEREVVLSPTMEQASMSGRSDGSHNALRGTLRYMAPEVISNPSPIPASDIWSFGIMLAELATGVQPWQHLPKMGQVTFMSRLEEGSIRPEINAQLGATAAAGADEVLCTFLSRCWTHRPASRPTASELLTHSYFMSL